MSRILKVAYIANVFDPTADDAHYTLFRNHDEKGPVITYGEKAMWEVCLSRLMPSAALLGLLLAAPTARGDDPRLAISGYDPVAYFTDGKPVPGLTEFEHVWHDARWRFASAAHRDLFVGDPNRYAPQYDGYCAAGVADAAVFGPHKDTVDPAAWAIVGGKLYLTHTRYSMGRWQPNLAENIKRADANWPAVALQPEPALIGTPCANHPPSVIVGVQGGGRRAYVGAQRAVDEEGNVVGKGDVRAQIEQAGKNVQVCLEAAGAKASDIVLTRAYVTDADAFKKDADVFARYLGPASTVTPVPSLSGGPDFLVEIEAVATVN
jgi:enamine deaminase RidA (YjgF/YER057c/UK114 family)